MAPRSKSRRRPRRAGCPLEEEISAFRKAKAEGHAIGSIDSTMQCMMKEICAQCLQPQRDSHRGKTSYVLSCFNQDQKLDRVDFGALSERLRQHSLQEKLTAQWIARSLTRPGSATVR